MSKQAVTALHSAEVSLRSIGVSGVNLVSFLDDGIARMQGGKKQWRNSVKLACLIIGSAANAIQCENAETLAGNSFTDMGDAVASYISSNLDCWDQVGFSASGFDVGINEALDHLAGLVSIILHNAEETAAVSASDNVCCDVCRATVPVVKTCDGSEFGADVCCFMCMRRLEARHSGDPE